MFENLDYIVGEFFDKDYWQNIINNFDWRKPNGVDKFINIHDDSDESVSDNKNNANTQR